MKRDFSNESLLNLILRINRALLSRLRGNIFHLFSFFNSNSGNLSKFGTNPKFINSKSIFLNNNVSFGDNCRIECYNISKNQIKIQIGANTSFGDNLHIGAINKITIGSNVLCASKILIIDHNHGTPRKIEQEYNIPPAQRNLTSNGEIIIEDNVWIGEGAIILAGSIINKGAIIPAYTIVNGIVNSKTIYKKNNE
jgi:acetyltransferase-like isoleucine patch superfamily enzyme